MTDMTIQAGKRCPTCNQRVSEHMASARPRLQRVRQMREAGATFKEIGAALGVHLNRARQLYLRSLELPETASERGGAPETHQEPRP